MQGTQNFPDIPPLNCAVFAHSDMVGLVDLGSGTSERDSAEALASGWTFAGSIGVNEGKVVVACEHGCEGAIALGAWQFAGLFGEHLKAHQLALQASSGSGSEKVWPTT